MQKFGGEASWKTATQNVEKMWG